MIKLQPPHSTEPNRTCARGLTELAVPANWPGWARPDSPAGCFPAWCSGTAGTPWRRPLPDGVSKQTNKNTQTTRRDIEGVCFFTRTGELSRACAERAERSLLFGFFFSENFIGGRMVTMKHCCPLPAWMLNWTKLGKHRLQTLFYLFIFLFHFHLILFSLISFCFILFYVVFLFCFFFSLFCPIFPFFCFLLYFYFISVCFLFYFILFFLFFIFYFMSCLLPWESFVLFS